MTGHKHRTLLDRMMAVAEERALLPADGILVLMVSGGSDSTALAYLAAELAQVQPVRALAMLHVNHGLRGAASDGDERFCAALASSLDMAFFSYRVDISGLAASSGQNWEAVARHRRYQAARETLERLCLHEGLSPERGRICTAHTADDRIENFYMRSIVGTGPGGFRSMRYRNGEVVRPLLDCSREELRTYIRDRARDGLPVMRDGDGNLWREDATNQETDRFRAYVRHRMVPLAREWNPSLTSSLTRSMNLIADEDDMLETMADQWLRHHVEPLSDPGRSRDEGKMDTADGFLLAPDFGEAPVPLQRRVVHRLLKTMLGDEVRIDTATVQAVLDGFSQGASRSGYVQNVQGDLAVSANKRGVRVEPMAAFRARRKRC